MIKAMRKAQSYLDYAVLIAVISVSLAAMAGYVYKSIHARVHHLKKDLTDPVQGVR